MSVTSQQPFSIVFEASSGPNIVFGAGDQGDNSTVGRAATYVSIPTRSRVFSRVCRGCILIATVSPNTSGICLGIVDLDLDRGIALNQIPFEVNSAILACSEPSQVANDSVRLDRFCTNWQRPSRHSFPRRHDLANLLFWPFIVQLSIYSEHGVCGLQCSPLSTDRCF